MQEVQQVHHAKKSHQPEEIVQVPLVQVVGDPPWFPVARRDGGDGSEHGSEQHG